MSLVHDFELISTVTDTEENPQTLAVQSIAQDINIGQWGNDKAQGEGVVTYLFNICIKFLYLV